MQYKLGKQIVKTIFLNTKFTICGNTPPPRLVLSHCLF